MTDAEINKAIANVCGIKVRYVPEWSFAEGSISEVWHYIDSNNDRFDPANNESHAFLAAEKRGLFERECARLSWSIDYGCWLIEVDEREFYNPSCPRAICEAILAVTQIEKTK